MTRFIGNERDNYRLGSDTDLIGKAGDDYLATDYSGKVHIHGNKGDDTLWASDASTAFLFGGKGDDDLTGGANSDRLKGGKGNDTLEGGDAGDFLRGGKGKDSFVFNFKDAGVDHIKDFKHGVDKIVIKGRNEDPLDDAVVSYDASTGLLYLDTSPNDAVPGTLIARMKAGLAFDAGDWEIT